MHHWLVVVFILVAQGAAAQPSPTPTGATRAYRTGLALLAAEYWEDAAQAFTSAIDVDPRFTLAYYGLGRARMGLKEFDRAVVALSRCRDLYRAELGERAANQLAANQRHQEQMFVLREALREHQAGPQTAGSQTLARQLQDQMRDLENTTGGGADLRTRAPAFLSLALGSAYFRAGRTAEAEAAYLDAVAANPRLGEAHNNLAVTYLAFGRVADAERALALAERHGFRVHPQLKRDVADARPK
jgi:tetratricopeptide (TPR) repeat protein